MYCELERKEQLRGYYHNLEAMMEARFRAAHEARKKRLGVQGTAGVHGKGLGTN